MSKQLYDDKTIAQYLLGFLSETEAERFDKLSVTDDQFADALRIAEKDLVDAYVQGELTGQDLDRFETYYLSSPLRRSNVEFAHRQTSERRTGLKPARQIAPFGIAGIWLKYTDARGSSAPLTLGAYPPRDSHRRLRLPVSSWRAGADGDADAEAEA